MANLTRLRKHLLLSVALSTTLVLAVEWKLVQIHFSRFEPAEEDIGAYALYLGTLSLGLVFSLLLIRSKERRSAIFYLALGALVGFSLLAFPIAYIFLTRW